jgi:hypothetical protein
VEEREERGEARGRGKVEARRLLPRGCVEEHGGGLWLRGEGETEGVTLGFVCSFIY